MKMRDMVCLLELGRRTIARRRRVGGQDCGLRAVSDERRAKQRTGSTEQVDSGVAELPGDDACRGTGNTVGDIEESDEGAHRAAPIGGQHPFQGLHAESGENQSAAKTRDERTGERDDLIRGAPQHGLANRLDDERPQRDAVAAHLVGQMPKRHADEDEADAESRHDEPGMAPATRREVERGEGREAREADALQHQAETLTPDLADHAIERQALAGRRRVGRLPGTR